MLIIARILVQALAQQMVVLSLDCTDMEQNCLYECVVKLRADQGFVPQQQLSYSALILLEYSLVVGLRF